MGKEQKPYAGTQSVSDALQVLELFQAGPSSWRASALADELGLNRAKVYRILAALERQGLLVREGESGSLRLGHECVILAGRALRANPLRELARAELQELADSTQENASLDYLDGTETVVIDECRGKFMMGTTSSIGTRWPAHASSTGKVLLSSLGPPALAEFFAAGQEALTEVTICRESALRAELERVRKRGYASAYNELEVGYSDLSAPIFDHSGRVVAALSLGGATVRFQGERGSQMGEKLLHAAARISYRLGYRREKA